MNAPAKFLVLLDAARPALLIGSDKQLLGEVIEDDGFIVDSLLLKAKVCAIPRTDMQGAVVPPPPPSPSPPSPDRTPEPVRDPHLPEHPDPVREPPSDRPPVAVTSARIEVRQRPRSFAFSRVCPRSRHATKVLERKARAPVCAHQG